MPYFTYPDLRAVMSRGNKTNYALIFDTGVGTPTQSYMDKDSISLNSLLADAAYSEFFGGQNSTLSALNSGKLIYNSTVQRFQVSQNGGPFVNLGVGGLAGTGVAGQVTFWSGTSTVSGDSNFLWNNTTKKLSIGALTIFHDTSDAQYTTSIGSHTFNEDVVVSGNTYIFGTMQSVDIVSGNAYIFGTMQSVDIVLDSGAANNCFIEFDGGENAAVSPANKGRLRYDTITQKMQLSENTSPYMDILTAGGVSILGRRATAVDTAIVSTDYLIAVTSTAAPRTITLPDATTLPVAQSFCIVDESGGAATNNITIATVGGQTINGAASFLIDNDYGSVEVYTSGTNWFIK